MKPAHLYIHVPFCLRRCSYCDFAVTATREPPIAAWLDTLGDELASLLRSRHWDRLELETVYIGGGTPSLLGTGAMAELRARVQRLVDLRRDLEWTAEANPETLTPELADDWAAAGVNRVSLGAQTFHEPALRWMGRLHGVEGPGRAVQAARAAGIGNISLDLIFALPARLGRDWAADLERTLELAPSHVSLYGLTAEEATPLGRWVRSGREQLPAEEAYETEYLLAAERFAAAGFEHYEVSNFARPGLRSRHNTAYWTGAPYVGLGPGAHSYLPPARWWNLRDWEAYRTAAATGSPTRAGEERVEHDAERLEKVWLGLRSDAGLPLATLDPDARELLADWTRAGWADVGAERLRLTPRGWLLLDRLALELVHAPSA
ncbi:MAG: radical SAM family heme chaperone HemW [Longimicrobiales bacterium]